LSRWHRVLFSEYLLLYLSVVYFLAILALVPDLDPVVNLRNVLFALFPLLIVAIGETFVLITGGIDLSVGSNIACASVVGGLVMTSGGRSLGSGVLAMLACGILLGLLNGVAIARFKIPPFIVTLAVMMFFSGTAVWATHSKNIYPLPKRFISLGSGSFIFVPVPMIFAVCVGILAHLILRRTLFGRWLYAIGLSVKTAVVSGVPVERTVVLAYAASGTCAAVASIIYTARLQTASPILGQQLLLDVIAAPVIGGVSLFGGKGKIPWVFFGVLFITLIDNGLNLAGLSYFAIMIVKGTVILLAAFFDASRTRRWAAG
jgi:ribose/xylose/arabinose/galactoside ABC-type transport system permease subunit